MKKKTESKKEKKGNVLQIINVAIIIVMAAFLLFNYISRPKIAFVKSAYLLSKYQGFLDATEAYRQKAGVWEANIDTLKKELDKTAREFEQKKNTMGANEKKLMEELVKTKDQQLRQYQSGIMQKAQQEDQAMTGQVLEEVNVYIKEYGKKHGYQIIFGANESGNIVYSEEALDLTEEILEGLNKDYKK